MHPGPWWTQSTKRLITAAGRRSLAAASQPIERRHQLVGA
jgi:hypothetical protein